MKKIYTTLILAAAICIIYGFIPSKESGRSDYFDLNKNAVMIPDVMNKVNVIESNGDVTYRTISEADSFPNFPGFPKHVSGTSIEGEIFCNMDSDPEMEIVFNATYNIYAFNLDGSNVPGWPKTTSYPLEGAPSFGDIDGDGQGEIVATGRGLTSGGQIYAYMKNGTTVTGFPINHGYSTRTPVLADLDNNGTMEIIVNERVSRMVYVYKGNATVFPGWPRPINHVPASSAAVGDITGDGVPEIIAESYSSLFAWHANGDSLPGFPFTMPNGDVNSYSSPVLADLDGDNIREIVFGTHVLGGGGYVYVIKNNGTILSGWPKSTPYWIYSPPSVGFIDGDNMLDIAIGDGGGTISGSPVFTLYAWNKNGVALTGFPVTGLWSIDNQPVIADIDNDNMSEIIIDDNTTQSGMGKYLAYNHDGTPVSGWPIYTTGTTFFHTPCVLDINNNGILDLVGAAGEGTYPNDYTNLYLWNTGMNLNIPKTYNPIWQYNARHNGVYGDNPLVGISGQISSVPEQFKLYQNYPNPFNPSTKIKFNVPSNVKGEKSNIKLIIYDVLGREINTLVNGQYSPGSYEVVWNAANYSTGVYFYKLITDGYSETAKMVLVK
jgi:hypothetical protein